MNSILTAHNICRDFKSGGEIIHVLKNISIEVPERTLTVLRGRSGAGKTTLMNILGAIDVPTSGSVIFEGKEITKLDEKVRTELRRKELGFVFQSGALISNMTAYENLDYGLRIAGVNAKERKARAEQCLDLVGLLKRAKHFPYELSGGEAQRIAIARALAHRPKIIFADEPTAALDTNMALHVVKAFRDMVEKEGITVVMSTHDPSMMEVADCVFTLQDGEVVNE